MVAAHPGLRRRGGPVAVVVLRASRLAVVAGFGAVIGKLLLTVVAVGPVAAAGPAWRQSDAGCGGNLWPDRWC